MVANRDAFLAAGKRRFLDVPDVPLIGDVRIRNLNEAEAHALREKIVAAPDGDHRALVAIACVVNDAGAPLFTDDDLPQLREIDAGVLAALDVPMRRHALGQAEAREVAQIEKKSEATSGSASSSG